MPDGKVVGAAALAGTAADTGGGLYAQTVVAIPCPVGQAIPGQIAVEQEGTGNVDTHGAGLAVVAAAAELGAQGLADGFHPGGLLRGQGAVVIGSGQVLGQLLRGSHTGNDNGNIRVCQNVAQSQGGILNGTACQRLHVDKADVLFLTGPDQRLALGFHNVIGEHDGLHPVQGQGLFKDLGRMGGQTDVADLPGSTGFQQGFQCAAGGDDLLQLFHAGVVYLIQVNVVGAQIVQADVDVLGHGLLGAGHALGCQDKILPDALQGLTQVAFADGITPGGVDVVDPGLTKLEHQLPGAGSVNALNGDAAEAQTGDLQTGFSKNSVFHNMFSPIF